MVECKFYLWVLHCRLAQNKEEIHYSKKQNKFIYILIQSSELSKKRTAQWHLPDFWKSHKHLKSWTPPGEFYIHAASQIKRDTAHLHYSSKTFIKHQLNDIIFLSGASFTEHLTITVIYNVKLLLHGFFFSFFFSRKCHTWCFMNTSLFFQPMK